MAVLWDFRGKVLDGWFWLTERNDYCSGSNATNKMRTASKEV